MGKKKTRIPHKYLPWIDARKKFRMSHAHVQMARELGMNPKKLGGIANHQQEPWKLSLQDFIESLYEKRFGKRSPETVRSIEQMAADHLAKRGVQKAAKQAKLADKEVKSEDSEASSENNPIKHH